MVYILVLATVVASCTLVGWMALGVLGDLLSNSVLSLANHVRSHGIRFWCPKAYRDETEAVLGLLNLIRWLAGYAVVLSLLLWIKIRRPALRAEAGDPEAE